MKALIYLILMTFSICSVAAEQCQTSVSEEVAQEQRDVNTATPKTLKNGIILVYDAHGKEVGRMAAELYKVVPRKQQFIVTKTKQVAQTNCKADALKNRVSLMGGNGPKGGLDKEASSSEVTIKSRVGAVGGVQYQRLLNQRLSVGGQLQTNDTVMLNLGLDF